MADSAVLDSSACVVSRFSKPVIQPARRVTSASSASQALMVALRDQMPVALSPVATARRSSFNFSVASSSRFATSSSGLHLCSPWFAAKVACSPASSSSSFAMRSSAAWVVGPT
jgi:hypothetical protein